MKATNVRNAPMTERMMPCTPAKTIVPMRIARTKRMVIMMAMTTTMTMMLTMLMMMVMMM